jgi:hypothetical protein
VLIFPTPASFLLEILPVCPTRKAIGVRKICCVKTVRHPPANAFLIDFGVIFAKQDTNLASESAPKDAKMHRRRAIRFDSRSANERVICTKYTTKLSELQEEL